MTHQALTSAARRDSAPALTVIATLGVATGCSAVAVRRMDGMDMGVASTLGPFGSFVILWPAMMAAMMPPAGQWCPGPGPGSAASCCSSPPASRRASP